MSMKMFSSSIHVSVQDDYLVEAPIFLTSKMKPQIIWQLWHIAIKLSKERMLFPYSASRCTLFPYADCSIISVRYVSSGIAQSLALEIPLSSWYNKCSLARKILGDAQKNTVCCQLHARVSNSSGKRRHIWVVVVTFIKVRGAFVQ